MVSKADKLRAKRAYQRRGGRPRKEEAPRNPGGKIKQDWAAQESEREAKGVVIDARCRLLSISEKDADSSDAGSVVGLLYLDGRINKVEKEAAFVYGERMARYYALTGIHFPSPRAQELFRIGGYDGDVTERQQIAARAASNAFMAMERVLLMCPYGPQTKTTVFNTCFMDYDAMRTMPDQQLRLLKRGLRELALLFALTESAR
ncbi:MAG: hypothetical protein KGL39_44210 [Patescibacteria group bacterium]|nr:hypothetical protein [Patescibacteria group bacterium]